MHIQVVVTRQSPPIPDINIVTNPRRDRHSNCHIIIQDQELRTLLTFSKSLHQALKSFSLLIYLLKVTCNYFQSICRAPIPHFCSLLHYAKCPSHDNQSFLLELLTTRALFHLFLLARSATQPLAAWSQSGNRKNTRKQEQKN